MASSQALTSQTWRLVLLVVLAGMPLTLDPYGLHPFSVPKQAGLIAGAALAFFLWALAWAVKADAVQVDREARWLMILVLTYAGWSIVIPAAGARNPSLHWLSISRLPALAFLFWLVVSGSGAATPSRTLWIWRVVSILALSGGIVALHSLLQAHGIEPL